MSQSDFPSRRQFIAPGLSAQDSRSDDDAINTQPGPLDPSGRNGLLGSFSQNAMGCQFQVLCTIDDQQWLADVVLDGFAMIQSLEQALTVYQPTSQVCRINQAAGGDGVQVDQQVFELIETSCELSALTGGAFDVTMGPLTKLWGFHHRQGALPGQHDVAQTLDIVGFQHIRLDKDNRAIGLDRTNMEINLGGIGKGYALDCLCRFIEKAEVKNFLIHGGQSSIVARGTRHHDEPSDWTVGISHPLQPRRRLAEIKITNQAIGTSGSGRQSFVHQGKRYGHIIDPRTGWPADHLVSATVVAPTATKADALATAIFVLGRQGAESLCQRDPSLGVVVIAESPSPGQLEIDTFNMSEGQIELLV